LDRRGQSTDHPTRITSIYENARHVDSNVSGNAAANGFSGSEPDSKNLTPMESMEAEFIRQLISKYQGNRKLIATEMNVSERTLYRKLNRLNLN
jgi:transcriptional regulator with PAS, ATPase and Fis domain